MDRFRVLALVACLVTAAPATAQVVSSLDPSQTYLALLQTGGNLCFANGFCVQGNRGVPVSIFGTLATTANLVDATDALNAQILSLSNALNGRIDGLLGSRAGLGGLNEQVSNLNSQVTGLTSQPGAVNARLGSINVGSARLSFDFGHGRSQSSASGGVNCSFR